MGRTWIRCGESLGDAAAGRLPEDGGSPVSIRLEGNMPTIGGPDRITVVAAERQTSD
jgi:hypothetical protein